VFNCLQTFTENSPVPLPLSQNFGNDHSSLKLSSVTFPSINIAIASFPAKTRPVLEKRLITLEPFQSGQVWQLADSSVQIGIVGRFLVHYRHYKTKQTRVPISLTSKVKLAKFLRENRAALAPG
jgi:hypothetical protein